MIGNGGARIAVDLMKDGHPDMAATVWTTVDAVYTDGIGGGNEIVGAVWISWISILSLQSGCFYKPVNLLGLVTGIVGAITVVPGLWDDATAAFGILMIVWYVLAGVTLVSTATPPHQHNPTTEQALETIPVAAKPESVPELTI